MKNKISFSSEIYSEDAIIKAIEDYENICTIKVQPIDRKYVCEFTQPKADLDLIIPEFCNYMIEIMVCHRGIN